MSWFKNLIGRLTGKKVKVQVVETSSTLQSKLYKKPAEEQAELPTATLSSLLKEIFEKYVKRNKYKDSCLFFDPEEEECFVYQLKEEKAEQIMTIDLQRWTEILRDLKKINKKLFKLDGKKFGCSVSIFLTNLGERAAVVLFPEKFPPADEQKELRRNAIRRVNKLKPSTALTHKNQEHLAELIAQLEDKNLEDLYRGLLEEEIITQKQMKEVREAGDNVEKLLSLPVPRKQMVKTIAQWLGVDYVDVELIKIDKELAEIIPENVATEVGSLAFQRDGDKIKVAFWNPLDKKKVKKIEESLNTEIIPVMSCEEDIRYELEKIFEENI